MSTIRWEHLDEETSGREATATRMMLDQVAFVGLVVFVDGCSLLKEDSSVRELARLIARLRMVQHAPAPRLLEVAHPLVNVVAFLKHEKTSAIAET